MSDPSRTRHLADRLLALSFLGAEDLVDTEGKIGRYEVLRPLGEGAFGRVYLAHDPELDREVAIKVLTGARGERLDRFLAERRVVAALKHPNIVEVYDAGTHDGEPFLVMEYVQGTTLADAELSMREAARTLQQVALACHYAHQAGVIHHDLKPANVLLGDRPVVADFGVAKVLEDPSRTRTGQIVGTPTYMAPEQIQGVRDDARTDVYALGAILYRLVTGVDPYEGTSQIAVLAQIAQGPPPEPSSLAPEVPKGLEAIVLRAMAQDLDDRYASALDFGAALSQWLRQPEPSERFRWPLVLASAAGLAILAGALWGWGARSDRALEPEPSVAATESALDPSPPAADPPAADPPAADPPAADPPAADPPAPSAPQSPAASARLEEAFADLWSWELGPAGADVKLLEPIEAEFGAIAAEAEPALARRAKLGLARIAFQQGYAEEGLASIEGAAGDTAEAIRLRARQAWLDVLLGEGRDSEAWAVVERARAGEASLTGGQAGLVRAQRLLLNGSNESARSALEPAERERGTQVEALIVKSLSYRSAKDPQAPVKDADVALQPALDAIALAPASRQAYRVLIIIARLTLRQPRKLIRLDLSEHISVLRRGYELRPSSVAAMNALGLALCLEGYHRREGVDGSGLGLEEGIRVLEQARLAAPDRVPPLLLALAYATRARDEIRAGRPASESSRLARAALVDAERFDPTGRKAERYGGILAKLLRGGGR